MTLTARILLGFLVIGGFGLYFLLDRMVKRVERQYLEAAEEPMVDVANLFAGLIAADPGILDSGLLSIGLADAHKRILSARIYNKLKEEVDMHLYVTDAQGLVLLDSSGKNRVGADYSHFLDVQRTLKGHYGARSTREDEENSLSSVMYVGAPILVDGRVWGVVTVYKPQRSLHLFMRQARRELRDFAVGVMFAMLLLGLLASRWITRPIRQLTDYAEAVSREEKPVRPHITSKAIDRLAEAFEQMRDALKGQNTIEAYVKTLTHEMKSPVAAIRGAAELMEEEMPAEQRRKFLANIRGETLRLQRVTDRLLALASIESLKQLEHRESISVTSLFDTVEQEYKAAMTSAGLIFKRKEGTGAHVSGEFFLLEMALGNLLQNAIEFSPGHGVVTLGDQVLGERVEIVVEDEGPGVPDYARRRIFERFYSLPRPGGGRKSSGLGLCFVHETAILHGGTIHLEPLKPDGTGVRAILTLPQAGS